MARTKSLSKNDEVISTNVAPDVTDKKSNCSSKCKTTQTLKKLPKALELEGFPKKRDYKALNGKFSRAPPQLHITYNSVFSDIYQKKFSKPAYDRTAVFDIYLVKETPHEADPNRMSFYNLQLDDSLPNPEPGQIRWCLLSEIRRREPEYYGFCITDADTVLPDEEADWWLVKETPDLNGRAGVQLRDEALSKFFKKKTGIIFSNDTAKTSLATKLKKT